MFFSLSICQTSCSLLTELSAAWSTCIPYVRILSFMEIWKYRTFLSVMAWSPRFVTNFLKSFYLINLQLQVSEKWQSCRIQSQDIKAENCTYRYFIHHVPEKRPPLFFLNNSVNNKLSYRRGTARCVVSVEILPIATQLCRSYLYENRSYEVGR